MDNLVCPIRNALQQDLPANLLRSYLLPHPHGNFSPASQLALLRCGGILAEAIPTMTDLLTVPHNIGRIIVEDGATLCCQMLGTDRFVQFCRERGMTAPNQGITIDPQRLIRLERLGLFAPVFRVRTPQQPTDEFHIPPRNGDNWFTKELVEDPTTLPLNHVMLDYMNFLKNKKKIGMSIKTQEFSVRIKPTLPMITISSNYYSKNIPGISGFKGSVI